MLGQLLGGRYQVTQALSAGGFGNTYIAIDTQRPGQPKCVLKHLRFESSDANLLKQARRMFAQEAETLEVLGNHDRIPRLLAYFEEKGEFYLIQELITGRTLTQELSIRRTFSEDQVIALLQDVLETLAFVHRHGVIHRDLKPDNLIRRESDQALVLIDFGAVKTQDTMQPGSATALTQAPTIAHSVPVYTSGYAASEQCLGKPQYSSDLYALGMIAIQALTGVHPSKLNCDPQTGDLVWQDQATASEGLAAILTRMTRFHFRDRYASATEVLEALHHLQAHPATYTEMPVSQLGSITRAPWAALTDRLPRSWPSKKVLGIGAASGVAVLSGLLLHPTLRSQITQQIALFGGSSPELAAAQSHISLGDRVLLKVASLPQKVEAAQKLQQNDRPAAIKLLEQLRTKAPSDPEVLIYLNNARIGDQSAYTIAAIAPLSSNPKSADEILRGVAQAQNQINQTGGIAGKPLKVAIADDQNQPNAAKSIAQALIANPKILGVIGHAASDTSLATASLYQQANLVTISPVSSAVQLSGVSPYFFRTMPSDRLPAKQLSEYLVNRLKKHRVAIIFNANSSYSKSLKDQFRDALFYSGRGEVVAEIDLNQPDFNPVESLESILQKKADAIMLANSSDVSDRALLLMQANRGKLPILAGDALYSLKTLEVGGQAATGMVLAVPTQQIGLAKSALQIQAQKLWQTPVTWRGALSYDATVALAAAIAQAPDRRNIREVLANPQFTAKGSLTAIRFLPSGDPQSAIQLVQVAPTKKGKGFEFRALP